MFRYCSDTLGVNNRIGLFLDADFNMDGAVDFNDCLDPMAVAFGFPPSPAGAATEALFGSLGFSLAGFATLGCYATSHSGAYNGQAYYSPGERNWVDPERLEGVEAARLNLSAFSYSYEDQQYIDIDVVSFQQTLRSIDEAEVSGGEIEFGAQVTPTLLLTAAVGLLDATIKKGVLSGADVSGESLLTAPDRNVTVAASWDAYTGPAGRLTLYADVLNRTDSTSSVGNAEGNGHTRWNGRASFTGSSERWTVGVWGRNLGNEEYTNFYLDARDSIGVIAAIIGPPRTYGADVTLRF